MSPFSLLKVAAAQVPVVPDASSGVDWPAIAVIVGVALFLAFVFRLVVRRKKREPEQKQLEKTTQLTPTLEPTKQPEVVGPKVTLPPSELEAKKKAEVEELRR